LTEVLAQLDAIAPCTPLLALGQTVFWDEPMKAGVALLAKSRPFIAGAHDTDYFARHAGSVGKSGALYRAIPHNDTTTKGFWSAAGEFSSLFGSETVIDREFLSSHGVRLGKLSAARPGILDSLTEAFGWRGIAATGDAPVSGEIPLAEVFGTLRQTLEWAILQSLEAISEPERFLARERADRLLEMVDVRAASCRTLGELYVALLPDVYAFAAGEEVQLTATATTELLRFNRATFGLPRFDLVGHFINPATRDLACAAYNRAVARSEMYSLDRFMSGAIPFDLFIPGRGRGTIRIANRAIIIMTPVPTFIALAQPLKSLADLADAIERKLGPYCVLLGKAVTLIGMLAREMIFVFHEGASSYVHRSRSFHAYLGEAGIPHSVNPILRVRYSTWTAMGHCHAWLRLPDPLQGPFGAEELCAPSLAARRPEVRAQQLQLKQDLAQRRRPVELIRYLRDSASASWNCLAAEYEGLHGQLSALESQIASLREQRHARWRRVHELKAARVAAEKAKGEHFRQFIFEKQPTPHELKERDRLGADVDAIVHESARLRKEMKELLEQQGRLAREPEILQAHDRRRAIELEAELKRVKLLRSARIAASGLDRAELRPCAWWFPVVCPDGGWFRETIRTAQAYLETL
jgi:hypothetical protein